MRLCIVIAQHCVCACQHLLLISPRSVIITIAMDTAVDILARLSLA